MADRKYFRTLKCYFFRLPALTLPENITFITLSWGENRITFSGAQCFGSESVEGPCSMAFWIRIQILPYLFLSSGQYRCWRNHALGAFYGNTRKLSPHFCFVQSVADIWAAVRDDDEWACTVCVCGGVLLLYVCVCFYKREKRELHYPDEPWRIPP